MKKSKNVNKYQKFVSNYEKYIQPVRDEYYKNIAKSTNYTDTKSIIMILNIIPFIISIIILLIRGANIAGYCISILTLIIFNIIIRIITKVLKLESSNKYLAEIRKIGFFQIEDYEKKLKEYITGPDGYYTYALNDLKQKYNISDETTRKISTVGGEEYYIWANNKQDKINLLNTKSNIKPQIQTIKVSNIRYFRIDQTKNAIILKTDMQIFYLKKDCLDILNEMIKNKRLENITTFTPEIYINDFEIYMHNIKKELTTNNNFEMERLTNNISRVFLLLILLIIAVSFMYIIPDYKILFTIATIIIIYFMNSSVRNILSYKIIHEKTYNDDEYIQILNSMPECIDLFNELKYTLGISESYDKVYTPTRACYLTWTANGYFHVFLNIIYFNVVYMAIKVTNVNYYRVINNTCELKLKDKTLVFTKDSANIFAKILPNKDYNWLKGYQNNK